MLILGDRSGNSSHRKAYDAGHSYITSVDDPLWALQSRVFEFTNKKTGYNLSHNGQDPFSIIQYNVNDEYLYVLINIYHVNRLIIIFLRPHFDGLSSRGSFGERADFIPKGRVATVLMYCEVS